MGCTIKIDDFERVCIDDLHRQSRVNTQLGVTMNFDHAGDVIRLVFDALDVNSCAQAIECEMPVRSTRNE